MPLVTVPTFMADNAYIIRPYRPADRQSVRDICVATCWMGEYRPETIPDPWIFAEYWTRYFTDRRPDWAWVAARASGQCVGYLTGTPDVAGFERYAPFLLPGMIARVVRKRLISNAQSRRMILAMVRSLLRNELALPPAVLRRYPATWHFNLLPAARRRGMGLEMIHLFLDKLRAANAPGVHARPLSVNIASIAAVRRAGFQMVDSRPLTTYKHTTAMPIEIQTWGMTLNS